MDRLSALAMKPRGFNPGEVYLAVAALCRFQKDGLSDRERGLAREILRRIAKDVEVAVRRTLAEKLAEDAAAPPDLIRLLAEDVIEVARPIILKSPQLSDDDMLCLIDVSDTDHREAIAGRSNISDKVSFALSRSEEKSVLIMLARNQTASISPQTAAFLLKKSDLLEELREPLARRRHSDGEHLQAKTTGENEQPTPKAPPADGAQKLIDKLSDSGQLKAGYLLRVLNQGHTELFDIALAKLVNLPVLELRSRFYRGGPRAVALACRGVGIDRCVFPTVFNLSRRAHNMQVGLTGSDLAEVDKVFSTVPKSSALSELASLTFN